MSAHHGIPRRLRLAACVAGLAAAASIGSVRGQEPPAGEPSAPVAAASPVRRQIAEAEAALARLTALEQEWKARAEAEERNLAERLERVAALEAQLADAEAGSRAVSALFDRSKELLPEALAELGAAVDRAAATSEVPEIAPSPPPGAGPFPARDRSAPSATATAAEAARLAELEELREEQTAELAALERELREASLDRYGGHAGRLWKLRLAALEALPEKRRDRLTSLTPEGWAEIRFDFEVARLVVRLQWLRLRHIVAGLPHFFRNVFSAVEAGGALFRVVVVVLLWLWARRGWPQALERLRQRSAKLGRTRADDELTEAAAPWATFLLALAALGWAVGPEARQLPLAGPILILAAIYGGYRLATDLAVAVLAASAARTAFEMSGDRRDRLGRGVRRVLRVVVAVSLLPAVYAYRLDGGPLYDALYKVGLWAVALAMVVELAPWRRELADACLATRASGRWAALWRWIRDRPAGILLAPVPFLWLAGRGLYALGDEIASGYERIRHVTAYVARRRMDRAAQKLGYADVDLDRLPAGLAAALDETVRAEDAEALDHLPGLDEARRAVAVWRRGEGGGALLLAGESGIGKRAWIDRFASLETVACRLIPDRRLIEPGELVAWLGRGLLGEGEVPASRAELVAALCSGGRRIVVLEGAENLFLARVGGYRALAEMAALAGETRQQVFWLISMEGLAFNHLRAASKELAFLQRVIVLPAWSEEQIRRLLDRRLAAGGQVARCAELFGELKAEEDAAARERQGERAYVSLLSDFAGGNPRVALHFFLRSLVPGKDGQVAVRPFRGPPEEELSAMNDEAHFLLAAVARHGSLDVDEASAVTAYPPAQAEIFLGRLLDLGVVAAAGGRFRVTTHWQSTVQRLLRRRNVLVS